MGEVYVARDITHDERVALKVMNGSSAASVERFEREGRIAMTLSHRRIVAGRGCGQSPDGRPWIAMELLRGEDLEARLSRGPLSPRDAVAVVIQLCEALEHAHARGVVHRDLKPSNVFLCEGATIDLRVLDFGIARLASDHALTRTGSPIGTPSYMSPEQARGERDLDARSDLWSVGVLLFECLTGTVPFHAGSVVGTLYLIVSAELPDLQRLRPGLPATLVSLVRRCLSKRRDDRPASAAALRASLIALDTLDVSATPPRLPDGPSRTMTTATQLPPLGVEEQRLTTVVCLEGVRDAVFVEGVARGLQGRITSLASGATLCLFGVERWTGDEPRRALRFARAVVGCCRAAGVATGRVLRRVQDITGDAIDRAAALTVRDGLSVDDATEVETAVDFDASPEDGSAPPATPFVGRDIEVQTLQRTVQAAVEEVRLRAVVVLAPAGMGKSRLRREALGAVRSAVPDARALVLRGDALQRDVPFAALRDAVARALDPSVAALFHPTPGTGDPVAALDRARGAWRAVLETLTARGPLVLVIDDAQWLDASTRATLRWAREQRFDLPVALWIFGRPEALECATDLAGPVAPSALAPLDRGASEHLLRSMAGAAPAPWLERAAGHPLFLEALARLAKKRGVEALGGDVALPLSIEGAHLTELDQLPQDARELARRAAVFGRVWWADGAAALGGAIDALAALREANVIVPRPRGRFADAREYAFRAASMQEVALSMLPDGLRASLHGAAARWLSARDGAAPEELARHWELASEPREAAACWALAAASAASVADVPTACAHAARALALGGDDGTRWRALTARDDALQVAGDPRLQREGLDALDALARASAPTLQLEAAWRRCYFFRLANDTGAARDEGMRAVALATMLDAPRWGALARVELALMHADDGRADEACACAAEVLVLAARAGDPWLTARARATDGYVRLAGGDASAALVGFEAAAEGFARVGDRRREALMHNNAAAAMLRFGRLAEAAQRFEAAREGSRRVGNAVTAAVATHNLGVIRRLEGDFAAARAAQDEAATEADRLGFARLASFVATERVWLALRIDDRPALRGLAAEALRRAEDATAGALVNSALAASVRASAREGNVDASIVDRLRAASAGSPEARLERAVALWEAGGRSDNDAAVARAAFEALVAELDDPADRATCASVLAKKHQVPDHLRRAAGTSRRDGCP